MGAGKITLYRQRFAQQYRRISLATLKTRKRETATLAAAITDSADVVIDNATPLMFEGFRNPSRTPQAIAVAGLSSVGAKCL